MSGCLLGGRLYSCPYRISSRLMVSSTGDGKLSKPIIEPLDALCLYRNWSVYLKFVVSWATFFYNYIYIFPHLTLLEYFLA